MNKLHVGNFSFQAIGLQDKLPLEPYIVLSDFDLSRIAMDLGICTAAARAHKHVVRYSDISSVCQFSVYIVCIASSTIIVPVYAD